jgi:putative NADPH-quinone reductase
MRTLVVYCHPNPDSLVAAARDRAIAGLERAGHEVRICDLYAEGFDPVMSADERRTHTEPGVAPELQRYADDLRWAEALVLVYPTWWSGQPAMLKGWIDRVWVAGVAWDLPEGANRLRPGLQNVRRIVTVTTHGSSKFINAVEGESGKRTMTRAIRTMCSRRTRTTWCAIYGLDTTDADARHRWLDRVERTLARLS